MQEHLERIERNQHVIMHALRVLIKGQVAMSQIHDELTAALSANGSVAADIKSKVATLASQKDETDSAFSDALATVQAQGQELAEIQSALAAAITADAPADAPAAGTTTQEQPAVEQAPTASAAVDTTVEH